VAASSITSSVDVAVIGGGLVGASAAAHLALTGRSVVLVERDEIASGASGRNSGVVQHPLDPVLIELHLETLDLYRALEGLALPDAPVGLLYVTRDLDGARRLSTALASSHPSLRPTFLPPDEVRRLEPAIAHGVAACRLDIGYPVAPAAATRAYAAWAQRLGVGLEVGSRASVAVRTDGRIDGVTTEDGRRIEAHDIVVAAGPWSPAVVDPSGAWRPIRSSWGVVVPVTLPAPPAHVLEEAEISIEPGHGEAVTIADAAAADDLDADHAFSLVTADGATSLGSTFLDAEPDAEATVPALIRRGATFVPAIADAAVGPARRCARPLSLDGRPLVGRVPGIDRLWIVAGHGPWGISTGPATGRLVADLIDGRVATPPPAIDPARFGQLPPSAVGARG
jgi:glycine/D-amino acid oxidase-like deaminating enzyme